MLWGGGWQGAESTKTKQNKTNLLYPLAGSLARRPHTGPFWTHSRGTSKDQGIFWYDTNFK